VTARILLLVPLVAAGVAGPASDPQQYDVRIRGTALAVIARQGPGGMEAEAETRPRDASARLSVTSGDSAGGRTFSIHLDTLALPTPPMPQNAQMRGHENGTGSTWEGTIPAAGTPVQLSATGPASARLLDETVLLLFPRLPVDARPGAAWSDTARFELGAGTSRVSGRTVSDYRITGGSARAGLEIERTFTGERTSRVTTPEGELLIESRVRGTAAYTLDARGDVASVRITRNLKADMHLPQLQGPLSGETSDTIEVARAPR
jgi:hypothetical protein